MRRIGIASILVLTAALLAGPAGAARVVDVRVGQHPDYTRVVVELDEPASYGLRIEELPREGGSVSELVLDLEASGAFVMGRPRGLVESVRVKPRGSGSEARIRLSTSGPAVKEMVLSDPPRIVLDLRRAPRGGEAEGGGAAGTTGAGDGETRTSEPAAAGEETPAGAAEPRRAPSAETTEAPSTAAAPTEPTPQRGAGQAASAGEETDTEPGKSAGSEGAEGLGDAPIAAAPEAEAPPGAAQAPRSAATPSPGEEPRGEAAPGEPRERPSAARPTPGRERGARPAPSSQPSSWTEALGDPRLVWMIVAIVVLFAVWGLLRRRARSHAEARDFPPVPPAEGPLQPEVGEEDEGATVSERDVVRPEQKDSAGTEGPEAPEATRAEPGSPTEESTPSPPSPSSPPAPGWGATAEEAKPEEALADEEPELPSIPGAGPAAGATASAAASRRGAATAAPGSDEGTRARAVEELERRLQVLESRVEELVDGRERAERQLAAHTEELRVQRSAIARAQRVLRSLTRPDEATEPAPRGPSRDSGA